MKINLVKNGIFPITRNSKGQQLNEILDTGLDFSGTLQGEGMYLGIPSLFIRTSGCNLRCAWVGADGNGSPCDTPYSSHAPEKNQMEIEEIVRTIEWNCTNTNGEQRIFHVVISGGEPTMQGEALVELCRQLSESRFDFKITIETNGTIYVPELTDYVHLMSISPKLSSSTPHRPNLNNTPFAFDKKTAERHEKLRMNYDVLARYHAESFATQYKFVVSTSEDLNEIRTFHSHMETIYPGFNRLDIMLMPEGVTPEHLALTGKWVAGEAIKNGYSFTPRLHAMLFGIARGV